MYDIKPLELEWKKYRKKRQKPWYIGGLVFIILALLAITFSSKVKIDLSAIATYFKTTKSNSSPIVNEVKSDVLLNDAIYTLETQKHIVIETVEETKPSTPNILVDIPVLENLNLKQEHNIENTSEDNAKKIHLNIIETSSVTAYKDVENRFLQSHDVNDAMFLAKSYYKKGLFVKSQYWALETNKIDENIEESLLIFAKSKAKLGHKNEAVSILTKYIDKTASVEAKDLLFRIKNDSL